MKAGMNQTETGPSRGSLSRGTRDGGGSLGCRRHTADNQKLMRPHLLLRPDSMRSQPGCFLPLDSAEHDAGPL